MVSLAPIGNALTFTRTGRADAGTVAGLREQIRRRLTSTVDTTAEHVGDMVLAIDEALSNCAEHAYREHPYTGLMTLDISYDTTGQAVKVCVTDQGSWIEPDPAVLNAIGGRGMILMHALADHCAVRGRDDGTTVDLHFHCCPARERATAQAS